MPPELVARLSTFTPTPAAAATDFVRDEVAQLIAGPWITLVLLTTGVFLARRRMPAVVAAGLGVATALVVLTAELLVARSLLIGAVPVAGAPAAASGFDILVGSLRASGRGVLVLALVVALGAFLAGSSATATAARGRVSGLLGRIRAGGRRPGRWAAG